ncbi:hypothetical protein [Streptomyces sp. PanSC9]|uniref:hypothetical protein n=1 Tax=Streptomyces sp. PanSC9 TaxID=1520461 RepID=UPI000F49F9F0|nr:hypothetical protein [Streptomyces sp. PanSC9]ROP44189.1 hypothetical protein EDD94_7974 [Streptomyces sp. PanSC9]
MSVSKRPKSSTRPKASAASPDQMVELYGPDTDGWYDTRVMDWIALCEQLKDGEVRAYLILRSLVVEKFKNHVRVLTLQLLCELIPSPSGGPSSLTRVRGILDGLTKVGLVTTPEGQPLKTSSRASALTKTLRIRINDRAPESYTGWRNSEDKLKALGTALADLVDDETVTGTAPAPRRSPSAAGRISDPQPQTGRKSDPAGRISDPAGRISDPLSRISDPHTASEQVKRGLPLVFPSGSSSGLSPVAGGAEATGDVPSDGEREKKAAPEGQTPAVATEVPQQRARSDEHAAARDRIVAAYAAALGRPVLNGTRGKLEGQAVELLAQGLPEDWLCDRARELAARGWADLAQHAERSTAPLPSEAPATRRTGLPEWCGQCGEGTPAARLNPRFRTLGELGSGERCPRCHPAVVAPTGMYSP